MSQELGHGPRENVPVFELSEDAKRSIEQACIEQMQLVSRVMAQHYLAMIHQQKEIVTSMNIMATSMAEKSNFDHSLSQ